MCGIRDDKNTNAHSPTYSVRHLTNELDVSSSSSSSEDDEDSEVESSTVRPLTAQEGMSPTLKRVSELCSVGVSGEWVWWGSQWGVVVVGVVGESMGSGVVGVVGESMGSGGIWCGGKVNGSGGSGCGGGVNGEWWYWVWWESQWGVVVVGVVGESMGSGGIGCGGRVSGVWWAYA